MSEQCLIKNNKVFVIYVKKFMKLFAVMNNRVKKIVIAAIRYEVHMFVF